MTHNQKSILLYVDMSEKVLDEWQTFCSVCSRSILYVQVQPQTQNINYLILEYNPLALT